MERAIVLAAGLGSRLVEGRAWPKPLQPVAGTPLLVRILRTMGQAGIREVVVVTGHLAAELRAGLASVDCGVAVRFVHNDAYANTKNGVSLLAARELVGEGALLSMADHLFAPSIVHALRSVAIGETQSALGVDYDVPRCFDLDDATKVRVADGKIVAIGKEIATYGAIDCGLFRIGPAFVEALAAVKARAGDCSLSEGARMLAERGDFLPCDVGAARWIDVDTPQALAEAERMLRQYGDDLSGAG